MLPKDESYKSTEADADKSLKRQRTIEKDLIIEREIMKDINQYENGSKGG